MQGKRIQTAYKNVREVGHYVDAPVPFQALGRLVVSPEVASDDGAVFPEFLPKAVTTLPQRIASDRGIVGRAIAVVNASKCGEGMS